MAAAALRLTLLGLLLLAAPPALAHAQDELGSARSGWDLAAQAILALAWLGWAVGAWRRAPALGPGVAFQVAIGLAGLALFGPFDDWAANSTAWHMAQHMLLMVVLAPLAVLSRPWPVWRAALGTRFDGLWRALMRVTRRPLLCAVLHALAVWVWHAPALYLAALAHPGLHLLEHASFLFSAWLLWWSVLRSGRHNVLPGLVALAFTLMHTGMLGALLTFARVPLYAAESRDLFDQQLAGLLMWVPGGLAYLLGAAWIALRGFERTPPEASVNRADS